MKCVRCGQPIRPGDAGVKAVTVPDPLYPQSAKRFFTQWEHSKCPTTRPERPAA
jgi:hypothetical protein